MRPGRWWLVIGTLAMLGAYWCALAFVGRLELAADRAPYAIHVLGGAGGGALLAACVPVRPWRAPVAAGIACVALMSLLFVVAPYPELDWVARRSASPWARVAVLAAVTAAAASAGALLVRGRRAELGTAKIVVPRRCAIACACGAIAIIVFRLGRGSWSVGLLARATLAVLVYLGARVAWRWIGSRRPAPPDVPAAQLR